MGNKAKLFRNFALGLLFAFTFSGCATASDLEDLNNDIEEIDQLNILQATLLAMQRAVKGLRLKPTKVLVDGNRLPVLDIRAEAIVKGDATVASISAASILAKVERDRWCVEVDAQFPNYGFLTHKGYGTQVHLRALQEYDPCDLHRRSFAPVAKLLGKSHRP